MRVRESENDFAANIFLFVTDKQSPLY